MQLGKIHVERPLVLAPMEDITDIPFRLMARRLGADWVYTEFASGEALIRAQEKMLRKIEILPEERPVGIQIFGSQSETLERPWPSLRKPTPTLLTLMPAAGAGDMPCAAKARVSF